MADPGPGRRPRALFPNGVGRRRPDALDVRDRFPYERTAADLESRPERFHRAWLCSGVTAVFDVGGYPWTWDLRGATATSSEAPLVGAAGPLLSTIDHWVQLPSQRQFVFMASDSPTRAGARELAAFGTDAFKVWFLVAASGSEAAPYTTRLKLLLAAAADEARRAGNPLTLHGPSAHLEMEALARGGPSPMDVPVAATRNGRHARRRAPRQARPRVPLIEATLGAPPASQQSTMRGPWTTPS